ncbi:RNA-directed DNA polymerase, partial [Toxoplasma gondii GAB2-2007-GAL-DOM2]
MHAGQKPPVQDREAGEKTAGSGNGGSEAGPGEARLNSQVEREHAEQEHGVEGQDAENRNETSRLDRVKSCWQDQEKLLRPTARTRRVQEQLQDALGVPVCTLGLYCLRFAYRWNLPELFYFPEVATPLPGSLPLGSHREPKSPALYRRAPFLADPEKSEREKRLGRYVEGKTFVQNGENEKEFSGGEVSLVAASKASSEYFPAPTHQQTSTRKYDCLSCRRTLRSPERAHSGGERIVVDTDGREGGGGAEEEEDTARRDEKEGEKPDEKGDKEKRSEERGLPRSGGQGNEADEMPDRLTAVFKPEGRQGWEVDHLISLLRTTLLIEDTGLLLRHRTSGADTVLTSQQAPSHRATGPASSPTSRGCEASSVIPRVFEFPSQDACVDATVAQVALREHQRRGEWGPFPSAFSLHRSVLTAGFSTHSAPSGSPGPSCSRQSILRQTHPISAQPACAPASLSSLPASCTFPTSSTPGSSSRPSFPRFSPDVAARGACISEASASLSPSSLSASSSFCPRSFPSPTGFSVPSLRSVSSAYSSAIPAIVSPCSLSTSRPLGCLPTVSMHSWNGVNLFLKTPAWQRLYERIGSRLMTHLLTFTCMFVDSRQFSLGAAPSQTWPALALRSPACFSPLASHAASRRPSPGGSDARLGSERGDSETTKKGRTREESDEGEGNEDECDREIRRQTSDGSTDSGRRQTGEKRWGRLREEKNTRNGEKELGKKKRESRLVARDPNGQEATVEKEAKGRKRCRGRSRGERRKKKLQCKQAESCATDSRPPPHLSRTDGSSHPSVCLPCGALTSQSFISPSSPACAFPSSPQAASFPPATASCSTAGAASPRSDTPQGASRVRAAATNSESLEVEERKPRNASNLHKASAETGCANASPSQDLSSLRQGHQPSVKQNKEEHPRGEGAKANAAFKEKAGAKEGKVNPARSLYIQISGEPLTQARLCELRHIHCLASRAAARQRVRNRNAKQARQRGGDGSESEATGTVDREFGVPGAGRHEEEKKKGTLGPLGEAEEGEDRQGRDGDETQTHTREGQKETPGLEGGGNRGGHATGRESGEGNLETENRGHRVSANSREKATSRSPSPSSPRPDATVPGEVEREKEMDGCKSRRDRRRLMALLRRRRRLATREAKRRSHLHRRLRSSGTSPSLALFSHKRETSPLFLNTQSSRQPGVRPSNLRLPRQLICHHSSFNKEGGLPSYALMSTLALRSAQRAATGRSKGEAKPAETTADGGRGGEPNCVSPTRRKRRCEKLLKEATSQRDDKEDVKEKNRGGEDCGDGGIEARILTKFVLFSPLLFTPLTSAFGRCRGAAKVARAIGERTRETREVLGALRRRLRQMRTNGNGNAQQRIEGETENATGALSAQPQVAHGNEHRSDEEQKNRTRIRQREAKEAENEEKNEIEMEKKMLKHVRQRLTKSVAFKSALSRWLLKGFKELLARYSRCDFLRLLRRHCPAKRPRRGNSSLSCRGDCSLSSRGSGSSSPASLPNNVRFASSRGPRVSAHSIDASGSAPSPLFSPPPSAPSSPSSPLPSLPSHPASLSSSRCERLAVLRLETPPDRVIAFLLAALRRIVPPQLLGGQRNFRLFLKRAKQFALLNSRESVTLHMLLHSMKMRPYTALASRSARRQSRSRTVHAQNWEPSRKANVRRVGRMRNALQRVQKAGETLETETERERATATPSSRERRKGRERWKRSARTEKGNETNHQWRGVKARGVHDFKEGRKMEVKEKARGRLQEVFLSRIVFFLFTQLVIPLLRQHFYVTEAEPSAHRMRFFRKIAWLAVEQQAALSLHRSCFAHLDSRGEAEERRAVRGLAENAAVFSAPASPEGSVLKPGASLSKRHVRSRAAEKQRPAGGPKETQETAKKGTRSLEKAEKHGGLRRTRLSLGSSEGSEEGPGARDEDKEERRERDRAKRRRDEVSSREAEKGGKRRRHERREETEAVFERSERRENPEEVEGGRGVDGGVWAHTGRQSDKNEEDENDDWLAQEIEDYVNPEILARVQEVSSVPTVRFLPKARGCRPLVNLSQPHSGVLLAHLLSAALERMENKAKEDRERRQAARQRRLKVLRDAGAFCLLFGDTWAVAGGSGDAVGDLQAAARTGRRETEERRPEAGETGRQQGEEDGERAGKQLRKRVVQMVLRNVLRAANREMGKGSMESIGKGGIEDEKQLLARLPVIASSFLFDSLPSPLPPPFPSQSYAHFVRQRLGAFLASLSARQLHARHPPFVSSSSALRSRLSSSSSSSPFLHCFSSFHRLSSRSHVCDTTRRSANRAGTVRSFSLRGASFPALRRGLVSDRRAAAASQRPPGSSSVSSARRSSSPAVSALSSPSVSRPSTFAPRAPLSLNSLTSPIRSSLAALCRFHPSVLGCSVLSFSDVHRRLLAWWSFYLRSFKKVEQLVARLGPRARVRRVSFSQIFCVVGDLQACYEGLTHAELLRSVQRALARANVQKMHVLKLYKRVVSPPVRERARVRGGRAASRERRNRRQGRAAHMERAETRRPGRLREQSRASDEDGNEANVHTEDAPCKDAPWRGREESRGGRGREARGDREERETEARGSGGRGKGEARETGGGRVAETRRDSKQREGEREENELKKTRGAEGTEGGEGKEEERNVKRVTGAARFRQTETAHFVSIGRVDEVAVPARDGRQPLLATLLLPAGRDKRRQETAETSVSTGALSRARAGHHVRVESARLSSRATTAVRMDATSSSRSWSMSFSSSSKPPDSRSLPACIEWSSFDSSFSASLPSSSSFSCAAPFPEPNSRVSPPDAAAVFRRRLLRGSSSGGVVLVSDSNQRLMLDSRELLLSVRLLLRHHRIRFCQRRQPFHYSPAHPPGFPPVHGGGRHGAALEAAADPPGDKRTGGSDPLSQRAFGTQEEAAKRSGEPCSTRETDGEPEGARQRLSLGREDGKAGPNLGAKDWHQARGGQPAVGSEGRAWSTEGVRGGQKEECPGRERERREEAKGVYRQTIGIPQGSNISGLLCALFYADRDARPEVQALLRGEDTSHRAGSLQLFARPSAVETDAGEALHASVGSAKKSGDEDRETNRLGAVEDARRFGSEEKKSRRETEERDKRGGGDRKHAERRDVFFRHVGPLILEVARKTRVEAIRAHTTSCGLPVSSDSTPSCPFSTSSSSLSSPAACTSSSLSLCSPSHSPPSSSLSLSPSPSPPTASSSSSSPSSSSSQASFCRLRRSEREALHALERELSRLVWPPLLMRWVDDFLFLSPSRAAAEAFLSLLLEKNVWGKNVNRQKLKTDLFAGSWSSTAAAFQKRSGERNQAEADAPRTPSAAFSAASPGTQSERDAVREVAARCEGEAQECLTRLRSCRWKSETNWGPGQNLGRINEEIKSETEFSGAVGDQTKGLGRSDAGDMTVGRRKRTRPEEGSTPFAKKTEARKKIKRDTSSVERKVKTPSPSPTYSSLQIYPPLSSHSFASSSSFSSSLSSQPSSSSASSLSSSSSPCASASAPSGSGPCWAGVRFAFDVQRRGFCVLPLLRRDVTPDVESSGSLSEARERGRRANKETLGDTSVQSSIRDSLALQRGKRAFLGRGATANGAEFMAEMLEQRLLGHLAMRLGTTRVFVDLRLNSPEAACRNVYVVVKTAFLKLRCGLERIAKEFAGFLRPAYIL